MTHHVAHVGARRSVFYVRYVSYVVNLATPYVSDVPYVVNYCARGWLIKFAMMRYAPGTPAGSCRHSPRPT